MKVILVNIGIGIVIAVLRHYLIGKIAGILIPVIIFLVLLLVYNVMFELGWIKSFFVWILQFVIAYLLIWLVSLVLPHFAATAKILLSPSFFN